MVSAASCVGTNNCGERLAMDDDIHFCICSGPPCVAHTDPCGSTVFKTMDAAASPEQPKPRRETAEPAPPHSKAGSLQGPLRPHTKVPGPEEHILLLPVAASVKLIC